MKVAFITLNYPSIITGADTFAKNIVEELAELGCQMTVFSLGRDGFEDVFFNDNLRVIKVPIIKNLPFFGLQYSLKLVKLIKKYHIKEKFDIIHFNGHIILPFGKKLTDAPQIVTMHHSCLDAINQIKTNYLNRILNVSSETGIIMPFIEKKLIESAQKITVPSQFTKNSILTNYQIDPSSVLVIKNGIKWDESKQTKKLEKNDDKFDTGKKTLLFVGTVDNSRKGVDILLRIFEKVIKEYDCQLLVVGSGNKDKAISLAKSLNINDNIYFTGYVDENTLNRYYNQCDIFVFPSRMEGFGIVILEANAVGKPVIAFNVGAAPELIKNYYNGILIEDNDITSFANAILYLLKGGKLKFSKKEIISHAKKHTWKNSAKELYDLYNLMILEKG